MLFQKSLISSSHLEGSRIVTSRLDRAKVFSEIGGTRDAFLVISSVNCSGGKVEFAKRINVIDRLWTFRLAEAPLKVPISENFVL